MSTNLRRAAVALSLLAATVAVGTTPAAALTSYNVTTTNDVVATDGLMSLREAMILAGQDGDHSAINLGNGLTYHLTDCQVKNPVKTESGLVAPPDEDDNADGDLDHSASHDLTINGNGSTIDQTCAYDRVLHSTNSDTHLVINNTTIRDGNRAPEPGDNIRSMGPLTLQNGTLVTSGEAFGSYGYAVQVNDSESSDQEPPLTINNASISGNDESGARLDYGTISANGATVADNDGVGLLASFGDVQVVGSTVTGNAGDGLAGVDSPVSVSGSTVSENGKAVVASGNTPGASPITIDDSTIDGNVRGGVSCGYCVSITVTDSFLTNNGATDAPGGSFGAISIFTYRANDGLTVTDSTLSGNRSQTDGGAVNARFIDEGFGDGSLPSVIIDDSNLFDNRSGILSDGGALFVQGADVIVRDGSSFNGNQAKPAPQLTGGDGGAIWMGDGGTLSILDSFLTDNLAQSDGGAVEARSLDGLTMERSLVADNRADGGGGGLHVFNVDDTQIDDSSIVDNSSHQAGGGMKFGSNNGGGYFVDFDGTTVARNQATGGIHGGGGLFAGGDLSEVRFINSTVSDNQAAGPGAGVEVLGDGAVNMIHTTMVYNKSTSGEVANLYHQNGPLVAWATVIAGGLGGGLDCGTFSGAVVSVGYNISGDNSCGFNGPSDKTGVVALGLGALADNGGPTHTRLPAKMSPLVNVIPLRGCPKPDDQRNVARPVGTRCDVGAVEVAGHGAGPDDYKQPGGSDDPDPRTPSKTLTGNDGRGGNPTPDPDIDVLQNRSAADDSAVVARQVAGRPGSNLSSESRPALRSGR